MRYNDSSIKTFWGPLFRWIGAIILIAVIIQLTYTVFAKVNLNVKPHKLVVNGQSCEGYYYHVGSTLEVKCTDGKIYSNVNTLEILDE